MRSSILLVAAVATASRVFAAPPGGWSWVPGSGKDSCLSEKDAKQTAANVELFFANYTDAFARTLMTPDVVDYTDSVQFLMNNGTDCPKPLGTATFPNRASLTEAQGMQGSIPWENLNVYWDCDNVFIRWVSKQHPFDVHGIAIFHTVANPSGNATFPRKVDHVFSEFNSGAWLVNSGSFQGVGFAPGCKGVVGPKGNATL